MWVSVREWLPHPTLGWAFIHMHSWNAHCLVREEHLLDAPPIKSGQSINTPHLVLVWIRKLEGRLLEARLSQWLVCWA